MVQQASQGQNLKQMLRFPKTCHVIITNSLVTTDVTNWTHNQDKSLTKL